jgi:hypothetical protein
MGDVTTRERDHADLREKNMPQGQRGGSGSPWDVEVDVYLESVGPPATYRIESYLQPQGNGDLVFENHGRPGFNVRFCLHDETGGDYKFPSPPNLRQAIWSQRGTSCPTSAVWDVFDAKQVKDQGMTLVAYNANPSPAQGIFQYTLNVTNDNGSTYLAIDPGGNNMNGNQFQ